MFIQWQMYYTHPIFEISNFLFDSMWQFVVNIFPKDTQIQAGLCSCIILCLSYILLLKPRSYIVRCNNQRYSFLAEMPLIKSVGVGYWQSPAIPQKICGFVPQEHQDQDDLLTSPFFYFLYEKKICKQTNKIINLLG